MSQSADPTSHIAGAHVPAVSAVADQRMDVAVGETEETAPIAEFVAPQSLAAQLAPAAPARVGRLADPRQGYAFADRAYAMGRAFGEAPPDYVPLV